MSLTVTVYSKLHNAETEVPDTWPFFHITEFCPLQNVPRIPFCLIRILI